MAKDRFMTGNGGLVQIFDLDGQRFFDWSDAILYLKSQGFDTIEASDYLYILAKEYEGRQNNA